MSNQFSLLHQCWSIDSQFAKEMLIWAQGNGSTSHVRKKAALKSVSWPLNSPSPPPVPAALCLQSQLSKSTHENVPSCLENAFSWPKRRLASSWGTRLFLVATLRACLFELELSQRPHGFLTLISCSHRLAPCLNPSITSDH